MAKKGVLQNLEDQVVDRLRYCGGVSSDDDGCKHGYVDTRPVREVFADFLKANPGLVNKTIICCTCGQPADLEKCVTLFALLTEELQTEWVHVNQALFVCPDCQKKSKQ